MRRHRGLLTPAAIAAAAVGPGIVTGRETAAFFSQTAGASWLGIVCAGTVFALLTAGLVSIRRCTGAKSTFQWAARMPVRAGGAAIGIVHGCVLAVEALLMLACAWRIGALTTPFHGGGALGAGMAFASAMCMLFFPADAQLRICTFLLILVTAFEIALAAFGRLPAAADQYIEAELLLSDSKPAALLLGTIHAALRVVVAANAVLRFSDPTAKPMRTGLTSGGLYALCLAAGNLAIRSQADSVTALRTPLTVLAAGWGAAGFELVAALAFFSCVTSLYALLMPICDVKL